VVLQGIVLGVISVSLSAMTYWAFTFHSDGTRLPSVKMKLLLGGGADTNVPAFVFSMSRSSENTHHTFDRQVSIPIGGFRTSSSRNMATDEEGAVVRDHSSSAPDTPGAEDERSFSVMHAVTEQSRTLLDRHSMEVKIVRHQSNSGDEELRDDPINGVLVNAAGGRCD
jgi:hypothetical protein